MKRWYVGCLVAAVAVAILAGCSDGHGPDEFGGNGFPDVVEKIGGDYYAADAMESVRICEKLSEK